MVALKATIGRWGRSGLDWARKRRRRAVTVGLTVAAGLYRRAFPKVRIVGVTGSCGKTTTTELVSAVLERQGPVQNGSVLLKENSNRWYPLVVLGLRPRHRFCAVELSGHGPGALTRATRHIPPDIAIVTHVGADHYKAFRSAEAISEEKGKLVECLPADGVAILNADDPLVWGMRTRTQARVIGCGRSPAAEMRLVDLHADWPERLTLRVAYDGQETTLRTRFVGEYAVVPILTALAAAAWQGMSLEEAAAVLEKVEPVDGRMSPHWLPGDITVIDDTWKAPLYTIPAAMDFMRRASAKRKVIVFGSLSDYADNSSRRYRAVARDALNAADHVAFVGRWASSVSKLRNQVGDNRLATFESIRQLNEHLRATLRSGDLVLLKGSFRNDHLERLFLDRLEDGNLVACWRDNCRRGVRCQACDLLHGAA